MTEFCEAVRKRQRMVITKMARNETKMAANVHRSLKVIAFNAKDVWRRRYELSKQLQDLHIDVVLLSEAHLKPHERFFVPNYDFYRIDRFPGRKGIPHYHVTRMLYVRNVHLTKAQPILKRQTRPVVRGVT
jgi:hypothetical protein